MRRGRTRWYATRPLSRARNARDAPSRRAQFLCALLYAGAVVACVLTYTPRSGPAIDVAVEMNKKGHITHVVGGMALVMQLQASVHEANLKYEAHDC